MGKTIHILDYDPLWPEHFQRLRSWIWPAIQDVARSIEHVGSTAVPGLAAKPVIDIDIVIPSSGDLPFIVERLADLGYRHRGNLGIAGREAFRAPADTAFTHHLYVCLPDSLALRNHLALRDYLRNHAEAMVNYGLLKRELAGRYPNDMDQYIAGKSAFILEILRAQGLEPQELAAIAQENQPGS